MMFWRILRRLLQTNRARLGVILLALGAGAAITAALLNLQVDAESRLTREFRSLGANVVIAPHLAESRQAAGALLDEAVLRSVPQEFENVPIHAVPFLYFVADVTSPAFASSSPSRAVLAGTHLDDLALVGPGWKFEPARQSQMNGLRCIVGKNAAAQLRTSIGEHLILHNAGNEETCSVASVLTAGGTEDSQIFLDLGAAQRLAAQPGRISLIQASVTGTPQTIERFVAQVSAQLPEAEVRGVRQFTEAEGKLYAKIRGLLVATTALILLLTGLCVMAAMVNVAIERERDVGLMKALGGTAERVVRLFLTEAALLGLLGGLLGAAAGVALSVWLGKAVFGVAARPRLIVYPVAVALTMLVAIAGAFPLRRLAGVRPSEILRGVQ